MARLSARKRLEKPLLLGGILCVLAAMFAHRHRFFPDVAQLRAEERERYEQKRRDVLQRREKQLAELRERRASP